MAHQEKPLSVASLTAIMFSMEPLLEHFMVELSCCAPTKPQYHTPTSGHGVQILRASSG